MRPNTRVYAFFDKQDVNDRVHPATVINSNNPVSRTNLRVDWSTNTLTVDANGALYGVFDIPEGTFIVGERELLFADVDDLDSLTSATTLCTSQFNAYNFAVAASPTPAPQPPVIQNPPIIDLSGITFMDPLAETFLVDPEMCDGRVGCFLTKVDLYFKSKHPTLGITIELRTTENGYPTKTILPFSQVHKNPADITVSDVAANATTFTFPSPVYVRAGQEYAIAIIPDANNPDYTLYTAEIGAEDVLTPTVSVTQDWGIGSLFMSHNNSTWTAIQNEDLKFTLYRAEFSEGSGSVTLVNKDYEFLSIESINDTFELGEFVFQNDSVAAGNVATTAGNNIVTGTGTSFLTLYSPGSRVVLKSGTTYDVQEVLAVTNSTYMTVKDSLAFTNAAGQHISTPVGIVDYFDAASGELVLSDSSAANSTFVFAATETLIGETSGANCVITSVDNRIVSRFQPQMYRTAVQGTDIALVGFGTSNAYSAQDERTFAFNATNYFDNEETVVASKSNEITDNGGSKSLQFTITLETETDVLTPTLDTSTLGLFSYENLINNDSTDEYQSSGNAISRAVSYAVQLADGQDSEDIRVYLTAYRPSGTDIEVYVKLKNDTDSEAFNSKYWTKLERQTDEFSEGANRTSLVEIEYRLPDEPTATALTGVVETSNASTTIGGTDTLFDSELVDGDVVLISNGSDYFISSIASSSSNTAAVLTTTPPWTATGATISVLDEPHTAYRNPQNDNVVSYINEAGAEFDTFKQFAVKIVLLAEGTHLVPRVRDMRAIALTV